MMRNYYIGWIGLALLIPMQAAAQSDYKKCKTYLKSDPGHKYCQGYVKGYDSARGSGTSGTGALEFAKIVANKKGVSGTTGKELETIVITLPPNFKDLRDRNDENWAMVSDPNFNQKSLTKISVGESPENSLQLGPQISLKEYLEKNEDQKDLAKRLEPYLDRLDQDKLTNVLIEK